MKKKQLIVTWVALLFLAISASGCALIGAAAAAGLSYGLYQATKK